MMTKRIPLIVLAATLGGCSFLFGEPLERAQEAFAEQDYFAAREAALEALQDNANDAAALDMLARVQLAMGLGVDALVTLERLEGTGGAPEDLALLRAEALLQTGDHETAFDVLEGQTVAEAWRLRALAAAMAGRDAEAAQHFVAGRDAPGDRRKLFTAAATFHLDRGDADAARFAVGQAQQLAPEAIETLFVSARLAELDQRPDFASRAYLAILEHTPNDRPALLGAIRSLDQLGRVDVFEPLIARGRSAYPDDVEFIYYDASLMAYEGSWTAARELLQQSEAIVAEHDNARGLYGQVLLELGQLEQARSMLAPLNRRYPGNAAYARQYARVLIAQGEYSSARRVMAPIIASGNALEIDREVAELAARG